MGTEDSARAKHDEATRLATESLDNLRDAAQRERESRGAPLKERLRVRDETGAEEQQAIDLFGQALELERQAIDERAESLETATWRETARPPQAKPAANGKESSKR